MVIPTRMQANGRRWGTRKNSATPIAIGSKLSQTQEFRLWRLAGRPTVLISVSRKPMNTADRKRAMDQFCFFSANISVVTTIATTPKEIKRRKKIAICVTPPETMLPESRRKKKCGQLALG